MDGALKKGVVLLVILFLGFWLVQDPNGFGRQRQADRHRHLGPAGRSCSTACISFFKSISS